MIHLSEAQAYAWTGRIAGVALVLQSIELLRIREAFARDGIWRWSIVREDFGFFPRPILRVLDACLDYPNVLGLLAARAAVAAWIIAAQKPGPGPALFLFASSLLVSMRWRGAFNGGSDCMTLVVLSGLCAGTLFPGGASASSGGLWYIAVQACLSYFVAGTVKARRRQWWSGEALAGFLSSPRYDVPRRLREAARGIPRAASWGVILFECSFPLALSGQGACLAFLAAAFLFHLANAYAFGLNRFLFAWAAAYPALLHCSGALVR